MTKEVKIKIPVIPELDKRSISNFLLDVAKLKHELGKLDTPRKSIGKTASMNMQEIKKAKLATRPK